MADLEEVAFEVEVELMSSTSLSGLGHGVPHVTVVVLVHGSPLLLESNKRTNKGPEREGEESIDRWKSPPRLSLDLEEGGDADP